MSDRQQYTIIHTLIKMLRWSTDSKEEVVISYTGDQTKTSLKDMTSAQRDDLISFLKAQATEQDATKSACQNIRRGIIAVAHSLGWYQYKDDVLVLKEGKKQIDYSRLNGYLTTRTAAKKALNDMDKTELQAAYAQLNKYYLTTLKGK
jgi:hypothetical protein